MSIWFQKIVQNTKYNEINVFKKQISDPIEISLWFP